MTEQRMYIIGLGSGQWDDTDEPDRKTKPRESYNVRRLAIAILTTDYDRYSKALAGTDEDDRREWADRLRRMPLGELMGGIAFSWSAPTGMRRYMTITQVGQRLRDIGLIPDINGTVVRPDEDYVMPPLPKIAPRNDTTPTSALRQSPAQRVAEAMAGASREAVHNS